MWDILTNNDNHHLAKFLLGTIYKVKSGIRYDIKQGRSKYRCTILNGWIVCLNFYDWVSFPLLIISNTYEFFWHRSNLLEMSKKCSFVLLRKVVPVTQSRTYHNRHAVNVFCRIHWSMLFPQLPLHALDVTGRTWNAKGCFVHEEINLAFPRED